MQRYQVISQAELERIHDNSLRIMENIGIVMPEEVSKDILKKRGCKIDGDLVRFPRALVEECIKLSPSSYTIYSRNSDKNAEFSCENIIFAGPYGAPYINDMDRGRRESTLADFIDIVKICDKLEHIDIQSHIPCEPTDIPVEERPTTMVYNVLKHSEKPLMGSIYGYENAMHCIEMAAIPFGGLDAIKKRPVMTSIPCTLTPLAYDDRQLEAIRAYAETGQPQLVNSLSMAGLTTPVTLAGLVSLQNAEVLAGIVLAQCINPGTPVIYSASGSNCDMGSGLLTIGTPENALVSLLNGQLAKYYQIPCRISGSLSDSKMMDAQAAYESAITLMAAQMAGGNFILHAAGIIEAYNCVCLEKLIVDNEIIGYLKRIKKGVQVNDDTLAYDVIAEVGPQGAFLAHEHTAMHFREESYFPTLSNRMSYDRWEEAGSESAQQAANRKWKEILASYTAPALSPEIDRDLRRYMEKL